MSFAEELSEKEKKSIVVKLVQRGVEFIKTNGIEKAKEEFANKKGAFLQGEFYLFVLRDDGLTIVNGGVPKLNNKNVIDFKDSNGKYFVKDFIKTANTSGKGWVSYVWPHKITKKMINKNTYIEKIPGTNLLVCGGY
ncbi:MAG: hypothetical protein A2Y41_12295 [Spirochaetes bacterium GWB1_36_13]|nr:MAG: hypothetical protein A2Y41_12295 [Spirochaetes bacterium GWB1_36_13]